MKTILKTLTALALTVSTASASSGGEGTGTLGILFITFGACIVVFQLLPGTLLFCSMLKGLLSKAAETESSSK